MKEILNYQEIDMQLKKVENDILSSDERKNASREQQYLKECQKKLQELNSICGTMIKKYDQLKNVYADMMKKSEMLSKSIDGANEKKLEGLSEASTGIVSNLKTLEKELQNLSRKLETYVSDFEKIMRFAHNSKRKLEENKRAYNQLKIDKEPEIKELKKQLAAAEKTVDKALIAKYLSKHNEKNLPVFVSAANDRCGGCRMELPARAIEKLKKAKYIECENCGRVIYSQ